MKQKDGEQLRSPQIASLQILSSNFHGGTCSRQIYACAFNIHACTWVYMCIQIPHALFTVYRHIACCIDLHVVLGVWHSFERRTTSKLALRLLKSRSSRQGNLFTCVAGLNSIEARGGDVAAEVP